MLGGSLTDVSQSSALDNRRLKNIFQTFIKLDRLHERIDKNLTDEEKEGYMSNKMHYIGIWLSA
jgi:hypothetical protein